MMWFDLVLVLILGLSVIGGMIAGGVKQFFSILGFLIAVPITGALYQVAAGMLSFLPPTWNYFVGFFVTMAIVSIIITVVFLVPRKIIQAIWKEGIIFRLLGGFLNVLNAGMGLVLLAVVLRTYPVIDGLRDAVLGTATIQFLMSRLGFVPQLLPEAFRQASTVLTLFGL